MNCCVKPPMSPRSMVEDGEFDYDDLGISGKSFERNSEDERQEAQLMDALSIVQSDQSMTEGMMYFSGDSDHHNKNDSRSRCRGEIQVETVGIHTVDSSVTKDTANTQESTIPSERIPARQCHGVETKTQHARINFFKSPSHSKEDVEMELKIPSTVFSHQSFHTGTEASSIGSLSNSCIEDGQRCPESDDTNFTVMSLSQNENEAKEDMVGETNERQNSTENQDEKEKPEEHSLKGTKEPLQMTRQQWKSTKRELKENKQELAEVRDKAQVVKRELKNFNKEWESQQTLLRNKDKELERLRLIIADRTVQLTEKTGELSITKVALVASENGLSACKKQITTRNAELEKANGDLKGLKKALSDAKAELRRTKVQLEASAERRRKFSNKAMRLLLGDSESLDLGKIPNLSRDDIDIATKENTGDGDSTGDGDVSPKRLPARAKSWSFTQSGSCDDGEVAAADVDTTDCPLPYSFISAVSTGSKKEIGVQTTGITTSTTQTSFHSRKGRPIPRPTRSKSHENFKQAIDGTNKKSLDTAEETVTSSEDKLEECSLTSLYFDSTSKATSMDAIITTITTKNTETEDNDSGFYFDSASKTPSASGSTRKSVFVEAVRAAPSTNSSTYGTADSIGFETATSAHSRTNSLVENGSIEITASAVSHLTDPTSTVSDASFCTPPLASQSQASEDESLVQKGKRWRALMKKMKDNGEEEIESVFGSTVSDFDVSFYSLEPWYENDSRRTVKTVVTGSIMVAFFGVCSVALAWWARGLGVTYTGGVLNMSDSRSIVVGATMVLLLAFKALWNLVEHTWTRAHASFFKSS